MWDKRKPDRGLTNESSSKELHTDLLYPLYRPTITCGMHVAIDKIHQISGLYKYLHNKYLFLEEGTKTLYFSWIYITQFNITFVTSSHSTLAPSRIHSFTLDTEMVRCPLGRECVFRCCARKQRTDSQLKGLNFLSKIVLFSGAHCSNFY
jgi:hypothetical protein